jgi:hypothetical protein
MVNVTEIVDEVKSFLSNEISFEEFEDWSAESSWNIHKQCGVAAPALALSHEISGILSVHSDDETETAVRMELARAIRPFAGYVAENQIYVSLADPDLPLRRLSVPIYKGKGRSGDLLPVTVQDEVHGSMLLFVPVFRRDADRADYPESPRSTGNAGNERTSEGFPSGQASPF